MSFRISCQTHQRVPCFEVSGGAANHLESIVRFVQAQAVGSQAFVLDIRAVTTRPLADKLFIHVLKYPPGLLRKIAVVDRKENRAFCSLYERLVCTRGYQVRFFGDVERATEWLRGDDPPPKASRNRLAFFQGLTLLRHVFNPIRLLHATTGSR